MTPTSMLREQSRPPPRLAMPVPESSWLGDAGRAGTVPFRPST